MGRGLDDDSACVQSEAKWSTLYPVERWWWRENQIVILAKDEHRKGGR